MGKEKFLDICQFMNQDEFALTKGLKDVIFNSGDRDLILEQIRNNDKYFEFAKINREFEEAGYQKFEIAEDYCKDGN